MNERNTSWINTVKDGQTYIVNGVTTVPKNPDNNEFQDIQQWKAEGGIVEPEFTAAELVAKEQAEKLAALQATDADMPRIVEDLINTLVAKNIISETDLPQAAQDKLVNRRNKRAALNG